MKNLSQEETVQDELDYIAAKQFVSLAGEYNLTNLNVKLLGLRAFLTLFVLT
jgi:hypothetical protein